eukprot:968951-Prorocentrum_minimum.AAC.5
MNRTSYEYVVKGKTTPGHFGVFVTVLKSEKRGKLRRPPTATPAPPRPLQVERAKTLKSHLTFIVQTYFPTRGISRFKGDMLGSSSRKLSFRVIAAVRNSP